MSITLAAVATQFLERPGLSQSTIRSYELTLVPLLQQVGRSPIDCLSRHIIEQYLNSRTDLSYTTHNRHQAIIQSLLNFAVEQGYLAANPIAHLKRRKPYRDKGEHGSDEVIRYLTPQQLKALYSQIEPNSRLHTLVLLLHRTGAVDFRDTSPGFRGFELKRSQIPGCWQRQQATRSAFTVRMSLPS